jgi:hypothetical protein
MWSFVAGFGCGVYVGSYYDCRPTLDKLVTFVKEHLPEERNKKQ